VFRGFAIASLLGTVIFALMTTSSAHATAKFAVSSQAPCHNTAVVLHGTQPPTISCADGQSSVKTKSVVGKIQPNAIHTGDCSGASLWLYWDASFSGDRLCVRGAGQLDLQTVTNNNQCFLGVCLNWFDEVSSYFSGCSTGKLSETNTSVYQTFSAYESVSYVGNAFNDSFRYVALDSNC
jgi:hypothetical protein